MKRSDSLHLENNKLQERPERQNMDALIKRGLYFMNYREKEKHEAWIEDLLIIYVRGTSSYNSENESREH